ncbi:MAG: nucleotidyl transferase AbiEii/AbiGii toxin family protein [Bacteroidaceae bacterium]|nr:nucleotidyl transferase AbiEii/AbiGii toxin family protein [Bacteroidaceae bacterium]
MLSYETIQPDTLELLKRLMAEPLFSETRLVGGTALALQFGHRSSIDLDLFGTIEEDTALTTAVLEQIGQTIPEKCTAKIKTYRVCGIKVDFVSYDCYPWIDAPILEDGLRLASPKDIAAMKINAIQGRGSRKDFVDMYFLIKRYGLPQVMGFYNEKYPEYSEYRAMLSLTYFEDAEQNPMPQMFADVSWEDMKCSILEAVEEYNKQ